MRVGRSPSFNPDDAVDTTLNWLIFVDHHRFDYFRRLGEGRLRSFMECER